MGSRVRYLVVDLTGRAFLLFVFAVGGALLCFEASTAYGFGYVFCVWNAFLS